MLSLSNIFRHFVTCTLNLSFFNEVFCMSVITCNAERRLTQYTYHIHCYNVIVSRFHRPWQLQRLGREKCWAMAGLRLRLDVCVTMAGGSVALLTVALIQSAWACWESKGVGSGVVGWVHSANSTPQSVSRNSSQSCILNLLQLCTEVSFFFFFYWIKPPLLNIDPFI